MATLALNVDPTGAVVGSKRAQTALDRVKRSAFGASAQMGKTEAAAHRLGRAFRFVGLAAAAAIAAFAVKGIPAFKAQSAALAEVATLLDDTTGEIEAIDKASREFAATFGGNATTQVQAFYQAISAGAGSAAEATTVLRTANTLAQAGASDVTTAITILSSALNVYADEGLTAAEASDILFSGVKAGVTNLDQLSSSLGRVLPVAKQLGIGFDEVTAAVAGLTTGGISTAESVTGLNAVLKGILNPTEDAKKLAKELEIEFNAAGLASGTFAEFLDKVFTATGRTTENLSTLFSASEAQVAIFALAGNAGSKFTTTLTEMALATGITQEKADEFAKSLSARLDKQLGKLSNATLIVGKAFLEILVPALEATTGAFEAVAASAETIGIVLAGIAASQIPRLTAALVLLVTQGGLAAGAMTLMTGAANALRIAMVLLGGPIGLAFALAGAAAAAFVLLKDNTKDAEQPAIDTAAAIDEINTALGLFYKTAAPSAGGAAIALANDYVTAAREARDLALANKELLLTELSLAQAQNDGLAFDGRPGNFFADAEEQNIIDDLAVSIRELVEAEKALVVLRKELRGATGAVTGSDFKEVTLDTDEIETALDKITTSGASAKKTVLDLRLEFDALLGSLDPAVAATQEYEAAERFLNEALAAGAINGIEFADTLDLLKDRLKDVQDETNVTRDKFSNFFTSIITGAQSATEALSQLFAQIAAREFNSFFKSVFDALGGGVGNAISEFVFKSAKGNAFVGGDVVPHRLGGVVGGVSGPASDEILRSAKGNAFVSGNVIPHRLGGVVGGVSDGISDAVFGSGNVIAHRLGGVVNEPTIFPMSGGRLGSIAEDEPEGILPLKRGRGGRLGVEVAGGGGGGGGGGQSDVNVKNIILFDRSEIGKYMSGPDGERVILNIIERNRGVA